MGNFCAFYEVPIKESGFPNSREATIYVNLQSAANNNWYLGFGPQRPINGGHQGRALTPEGYEVLLPRRMSPKKGGGSVRKEKCDFKFSTGPYTPTNMYKNLFGLSNFFLEHGRKEKPFELQSNSISNEAIRDGEDRDFVDGDFDRKLTTTTDSRNQVSNSFARTKTIFEQISEKNSGEDNNNDDEGDNPPPLPSPLSLRQRKQNNKFRRKSDIRRRPSYFFDHNRRRDESKNSDVSEVPLDTLKTPLFSSLVWKRRFDRFKDIFNNLRRKDEETAMTFLTSGRFLISINESSDNFNVLPKNVTEDKSKIV